jgi:hypothetical protein
MTTGRETGSVRSKERKFGSVFSTVCTPVLEPLAHRVWMVPCLGARKSERDGVHSPLYTVQVMAPNVMYSIQELRLLGCYAVWLL